jgi:predicted peptidase
MITVKKQLTMFIAATLLCLTACTDAIEPTSADNTSTNSSTVVSSSDSLNIDARTAVASTSDLIYLPKDTGGSHKAYPLWSTSAKFGYYLYTPAGYSSTTQTYPLLIYLHGKYERGDGSSSLTVLNKVLNNGVAKLIREGKWNPKYPMMVVTPQFHGTTGNANNWGGGDPNHLRTFIQHMISKYRINPKRIYLTGLSHGGNGVYDYISLVDDASSYIAAAAPIAAYGARGGYSKSNETPIWTFVGENDVTNFNTSKTFIKNYNAQIPAPLFKAKISGFIGVGHDCWTRTYSGSGIGTADPLYDLFNQSLWDWFFKYKRTN